LQCELMMLGKFRPFTQEEIRQAPKQTLGALGKRRTWKVWNYNVSLARKRGILD